MTYYAKVWTRGSVVYAVQTDELLNDHESCLDWADKVYQIVIDGDFCLAGDIHPLFYVVDGKLASDTLSFATLGEKAGRPNIVTPEQLEEQRSRMKLTFSQLMIGMVSEQFITEQEGELWLQGTLPQPVIDIINTLPVAQRFAAKAKASRFIEALRTDPIVWALADSKGVMPEELDQFFIKYSTV